MAKLPRYMRMEFSDHTKITLRIKKWGIPIIMLEAMRGMEGIRWYHYLVLPKICIRVLGGGFGGC